MTSNETSGVGGVGLGNFFEIHPFKKFLGRHFKKRFVSLDCSNFFIASMKWHHCSKYSHAALPHSSRFLQRCHTVHLIRHPHPHPHPLHFVLVRTWSWHALPDCPHKAQESDRNIRKDLDVNHCSIFICIW